MLKKIYSEKGKRKINQEIVRGDTILMATFKVNEGGLKKKKKRIREFL